MTHKLKTRLEDINAFLGKIENRVPMPCYRNDVGTCSPQDCHALRVQRKPTVERYDAAALDTLVVLLRCRRCYL